MVPVMRANPWGLAAAALVAAVALSGLDAGAMRGSGSPDWDVGNPRSLTEFTSCTPDLPCSPAPAVFYPPAPGPGYVSACASSPTCIPSPPLEQGSPWFGTPPPSGQGGAERHRIPNGCRPAPATPLLVGSSSMYTDPENYPAAARYAEWSPIESLTNLRAPAGSDAVAPGSIANTPFNAPPATPLHNEWAVPEGATGDGRFHLDNNSIAQSVFDDVQQANTVFTANGDPKDAEGPPDDRFVLLGHDGYILGRFEAPVTDGPGYDFTVNVAMPPSTAYGTFCAYGATSPTGPFSLVHSAFRTSSACDASLVTTSYCPGMPAGAPSCPASEYCFAFDLSFYYTPLRTLQGAPDPGRMEWFLVESSMDHTPYLRSAFDVVEPMPVSGAPGPIRGQPFRIDDTSVRFGYPLWYDDRRTDLPYDAPKETPDYKPDPSDGRPDHIALWRWDFRSDPYALPDGGWIAPPPLPLNPSAPADRVETWWKTAGRQDVEHTFVSPGIFPLCQSVWTYDQRWLNDPFLDTHNITVLHQADPPKSDPWADAVAAVGDPEPILVLRMPDPPVMHCQPATVYNLRPGVSAVAEPGPGDPYLMRFYDTSVDWDWILPPGWAHGPELNYDGCCACPDCPPDGLQLRTWDFDSDGITDHAWEFRSRYVQDGRFCSAGTPQGDPPTCPQDPAGNPAPGGLGNPRYLYGDSAAFTAADVGATVHGPGIAAGSKIAAVLSPQLAVLDVGVFADVTFAEPMASPFVVTWPYDIQADAPERSYPRPGEYNATLRVCDHDWTVRTTDPAFGSKAWPNPYEPQSAFYGDPEPPFTDLAGNPLPDSPRPAEGHSLHACQAGRIPVRIPNHPPHILVPPVLVVAPHAQAAFTLRGTDTDRGQDLTLRPCPGVFLLPGMEFPPVTVAGQAVEQAVSFGVGNLPVGRYGPFCFEVSDGWAVTHSNMMLWVSGTAQDTDGDGVADLADVCPGIPDRGQSDADHDGVGDACQEDARDYQVVAPTAPASPAAGAAAPADHDGDGVGDAADLCPSVPDHGQRDLDGDGVGDLCDGDLDGDGVANAADLCPDHPDPMQRDADGDGRGDACQDAAAKAAPPAGPARTAAPQPMASPWPALAGGVAASLLTMALVVVPTLAFALRRARAERPPPPRPPPGA